MGEEAPPPPSRAVVVPRRAAAAHSSFRLPRRRKVHVVRLGGGARGRGPGLGLRRWLRRAAWRLAELCVAALSSGSGRPGEAYGPPWADVERYFAAPFVPVPVARDRRRPRS